MRTGRESAKKGAFGEFFSRGMKPCDFQWELDTSIQNKHVAQTFIFHVFFHHKQKAHKYWKTCSLWHIF